MTTKTRESAAQPYELARVEEYEQAAKWCAERGLKGAVGDPLPSPLAVEVCESIDADPEAFQEKVRLHAYALAMERLGLPEDADGQPTALAPCAGPLSTRGPSGRRVDTKPRRNDLMDCPVTEIREGMLVDLESCPYYRMLPSAPYELALVVGVERETDDCVRVDYDGIGSAGYPIGTVLNVEGG